LLLDPTTADRGISVEAVSTPRETSITTGAAEYANEEEGAEGVMLRGKDEEKEYLKVETVYGDSDEEAEEALMGERCFYGVANCLASMTNGRFCGNINCGWKTHLIKRANGQHGEIGWYHRDPNMSPKQRSTGHYHALAKSFQSQADREMERALNLSQMEEVAVGLGNLGVNIETKPPGTKGPKVKKESELFQPSTPMVDPMLDVPEADSWEDTVGPPEVNDMKPDPKAAAKGSLPDRKVEDADVLKWMKAAEAAEKKASLLAKAKGVFETHMPDVPTSGPTSGPTNVETMKVEVLTAMLAEEKQAREAMEERMLRMMMAAQKEALKELHAAKGGSGRAKSKEETTTKAPGKASSGNSDSEESIAGSGTEGGARCNAKQSGYILRNPSRATRKATSKWYVVLVGRQIGIYSSWDRARKYTEGYSNARFRAFKDFREAKTFFRGSRSEVDSGCEYESDSDSSASELDQPKVVTPSRSSKKHPATKKKVRMTADSDYETADEGGQSDFGEGRDQPKERSPSNERATVGPTLTEVILPAHAGADKSSTTNEVHEVNMANEAAAYRLLSPPGAGSEVERSLVNGALDVAAMPGKGINDYNSAETALQEISSTLAESLRGEEFRVRGRIAEDHRWKNVNKDHLRSIKTLTDVRETLELLHEIVEEAVANQENGWRAVLFEHMGWDDATVDLWLRVGVLPNLVRHTLMHYRALLNEVEYMCNGDGMSRQAEIFLAYHANKLALIRTHRARTRLQLIWMSYTYLRDAHAAKFVSQSLQAKQTDNLREELGLLREGQANRTTRTNRGGGSGGSNQSSQHDNGGSSGPSGTSHSGQGGGGGAGDLQCSGCRSKKIHPNTGRRGCPFKDFPDALARKMAKTCEEFMVAGKSKHAAINEAMLKHQPGET
jgi:hypothetical protein